MPIRKWGAPIVRAAEGEDASGEDGRVVNPPGRMEDINPNEVSVVPLGITPGIFPLRRGQKLTAAELAELKAAGLPAPQEPATLGEIVRGSVTAAFEALVPTLAKLIRNQGEDDPMKRNQTPPPGDAQQTPPAATETDSAATAAPEAGEPAGTETAEGGPEGTPDPADAPAEAMVRQVATAVFTELLKPFEEKLQATVDQAARLERSYTEISTTVTSQAAEMKRAFDGFRPGGQATAERGPDPEPEVTSPAGNLDWNWN